MYNRVFLFQISHFRVSTSFGEFVSIVACWRKWRRNSLFGRFSRKNAPVHASTYRMSRSAFLVVRERKSCSASRKTQRYVNSGCSFFLSWAAIEFLKCVCWRTFYKPGPVRAHRLILKDGAVPTIKDPGHDSELQAVSDTHQMSVFCWWSGSSKSLFSSAHIAPPGARFERIIKLYLSFINRIKLKYFLEIWRMQYYSIGTKY